MGEEYDQYSLMHVYCGSNVVMSETQVSWYVIGGSSKQLDEIKS